MFVTDGSGTFAVPMQPHQTLAAPNQFIPGVPGVDQLQTGVMSMSVGQAVQCLVPGRQKCAIPECPNPSYIDENGTVHKCCGRTHAKELQKRQCRVPQIYFVTVHLFLYLSTTKSTSTSSSCSCHKYWAGTWASGCAYTTIRTEEMCHSRVPESMLC